ncbi:MAG: oligosaccharyl transferase, archaeosortase A system-associated [Dehalococcoidia bacterium]|nr:oligosaccharyl transferase, archaeosortase A system-associated [Dehalococcoidia bacterium]
MGGESIKRHFSQQIITLIALLVIAGISLYIRIALPYDRIFVNGTVWFGGTDAWYHMRLVDNLVQNFPHHISFDPYTFFPHGFRITWPPFFDWLIAGIARFVSMGLPSQHTVDVVGAYLPPILGTLIIIPIYFIGKELFNRWTGLLAAALVIILPGEFLSRSLLGFTDHHVAESLFSTVTILFLILAVKRARERGLLFGHLINRNWAIITRPLVYTLLAGIFLGIYLLTWMGGLMLLFIIFAWLVIQFIIEHLRGKSIDYLCIIGTLSFLIASIIFLPFSYATRLSNIQRASLAIAIITPLGLGGISYLTRSKAIRPKYYLPAIFGFAGIAIAIFHTINPHLLHSMLNKFGIFSTGHAGMTIVEANPLLFPQGVFSWEVAWLYFATTFFISFISIGWLIYRSIKEESADKTLFLLWSIVMLAAVLAKRRFSYYYAINTALLTGYLCWRILDFAGLRELATKPRETVKKYIKKTEKRRRGKAKIKVRGRQKAFLQTRAAWIKVIAAGVVIFFLVFFPCIGLPGIKPYAMVFGRPVDLLGHPIELRIKLTQPLAKKANFINHAWYDSLLWLRDNSPEPFGNPDYYYELYETPPKQQEYEYPESAYSIMSWWDYGHWITRIAHRIPICNPFQKGVESAANYFIAQDEGSANNMLEELDSRYVIINHSLPTSKFYALPTWAGKNPNEFYGTYYVPQKGGKLKAVTFFYPSYYQSTVVRLYNFDGEATTPRDSTIIISYMEKVNPVGKLYREITGVQEFSSYEEAEAYISKQELGKYVLGNYDAFATPVPLEKMEHYQLVHTSAQKSQGKPEVKIFEYTKN